MAARKSSPVVTREELAESVTEEAPTTSAAAIASELAPLMRGADSKFNECRVAWAGVNAGVKPDDIATETTRVMAEAMAAHLPENKRAAHIAAISKVSRKDGGASITRPAIVQRKDAWQDLVSAGLTPTPALIESSLRVTSTGGTAELRKKLIADTKKVNASTRPFYYTIESAKRLGALKDAKAAEKAEAAAKASADNKSEAVVEEVVIEGVDAFSLYVRAFVAMPHTDEERAELAALFSTLAADLSE